MTTKASGARFRRNLATLNRRLDFLEERIKNYKGFNDSRDKAEATALKWVIDIVESYPDEALRVLKTYGAVDE